MTKFQLKIVRIVNKPKSARAFHSRIVSKTARKQPVYNPATGEISKEVEIADAQTVNEAVQAAEQAFPAWRDTPVIKRARVMFKFKQLLEQNAEKICALIGQEHGKISHDAQGELQRGIENVEYACGAPELLKGNIQKCRTRYRLME